MCVITRVAANMCVIRVAANVCVIRVAANVCVIRVAACVCVMSCCKCVCDKMHAILRSYCEVIFIFIRWSLLQSAIYSRAIL